MDIENAEGFAGGVGRGAGGLAKTPVAKATSRVLRNKEVQEGIALIKEDDRVLWKKPVKGEKEGAPGKEAKPSQAAGVGVLNKIEFAGNAPLLAEFGGSIVGGAVGLTGNSRAKYAVKSITTSVVEASRRTKAKNYRSFGKNYTKVKHQDAVEALNSEKYRFARKSGKLNGVVNEEDVLGKINGSHSPRIAAAERRVQRLEAKIAADAAVVENAAASSIAAPTSLQKSLNQTFEKIGGSRLGQNIEKAAQNIVGRRAEKASAKFADQIDQVAAAMKPTDMADVTKVPKNAMGKARQAVTQTVGKAWRSVTGKKPDIRDYSSALPDISSELAAAKSTGDIQHLHAAQAKLELAAKESPGKGLSKLISRMMGDLEAAIHHGAAAQSLNAAKVEGMGSMGGSLMKSVGHMSIFASLIAVGTVAGIGVIGLTARHESKESKAALAEVEADIGANNPLMDSVRKAFKHQNHGRAAGAVMTGAGTAVNGVAMAATGAGMNAFMVSMALPMIGQSLVPDNALLNSYRNLKLEEAGKITLKPTDKLACVNQWVGAAIGDKHGGYYNKLAKPMAEKIIAMHLSTSDTLKLIADAPKFTALAAEAKAELDAKKAEHPAADAKGTAPEEKTATVAAGPASAATAASAPAAATGPATAPAPTVVANDNHPAPATPELSAMHVHADGKIAPAHHHSKTDAYHAMEKPSHTIHKAGAEHHSVVAEKAQLAVS